MKFYTGSLLQTVSLVRKIAAIAVCTYFFAEAAAALDISDIPYTSGSAADTAQIIQRLEKNQVFNTSIVEAVITVQNRLGTTVQEVKSWGRKNGDTLIEITSGSDRGQKILRLESSVYLYYPEAEEIIRLQGAALKESMMGSDFSYEDLTGSRSIMDTYDAQYLGMEEADGNLCYHLLLTAKTKNAAYQKEELFVDTKLFVSRKVILYSASGKALRELISSDFAAVNGIPFSHKSVMRDLLKKNSSTTMEVKSVEINIPISNSYFNREELSW